MEINEIDLFNKHSIYMVSINIIELFPEYNISKYIYSEKYNILDFVKNIFTDINNYNSLNQNINSIKEIIKIYAKVRLINENHEISNTYMKKDLENYFDAYCNMKKTNSKKIYLKDELFLDFKNNIISHCKIQDPKYIFNQSVIVDGVEINFLDIQDKLYDLLYTTDITKFVDMYICNNACECTQQKLCNLRNEILTILYSTLSYKPTNIIISDTEMMNNTVVDDIEIYNRIHNFLTSKTFDVYSHKTFPQIYLPS